MYVRGYLQGSENGLVVTIAVRQDFTYGIPPVALQEGKNGCAPDNFDTFFGHILFCFSRYLKDCLQ